MSLDYCFGKKLVGLTLTDDEREWIAAMVNHPTFEKYLAIVSRSKPGTCVTMNPAWPADKVASVASNRLFEMRGWEECVAAILSEYQALDHKSKRGDQPAATFPSSGLPEELIMRHSKT